MTMGKHHGGRLESAYRVKARFIAWVSYSLNARSWVSDSGSLFLRPENGSDNAPFSLGYDET